MRNVFAETLYKEAIKNKKIYVVAADISPAGSMEKLRKKYPDRFVNTGVAEQSMIGISAGLAMRGMKPFAYTIATFALYRPFEMIRDDICYQNLPVTIVGMGAGTIYSTLGGTHLTQEDISIARSIPNMTVLAPSDLYEMKSCIKYLSKFSKNPCYLRIGKSGEKDYIFKESTKWKFGKIRKICDGENKTCIVTYGPIIKTAIEVKKKSNIAIFSAHTLKPFDYKSLKNILKKYKKIIILEDHSEIGGLSSICKEFAHDNGFQKKIKNFSLKDKFFHFYGSQKELLEKKHGITVEKILKEVV